MHERNDRDRDINNIVPIFDVDIKARSIKVCTPKQNTRHCISTHAKDLEAKVWIS